MSDVPVSAVPVSFGPEEAAFTELVEQHGPAVLGYLTRRVDVVEDAADLLSVVLFTAWRRWPEVPAPPHDCPWLFGVARNVLANHHRSGRRRDAATRALGAALTTAAANLPEPTATILDVRTAVRSLEPLDEEILTLTVWEGLTSAEVGAVVGLPPSTVRARLVRARAEVRARITSDVDFART